jgi:hypothetical protein
MSDIYAMRRANGDWFSFEDHGRTRVPLYHSSQDGLIARRQNFEMLLFKPVALNARLLGEMVAGSEVSELDFCLVKDPSASRKRGSLLTHAQLGLLISTAGDCQPVPDNGNRVAGAHL